MGTRTGAAPGVAPAGRRRRRCRRRGCAFDSLGRFRERERNPPIDPSGDLDGAPLADARALAGLISRRPELLDRPGEHVPVQARLQRRVLRSRDLTLSRTLNPELLGFSQWLGKNAARIPLS